MLGKKLKLALIGLGKWGTNIANTLEKIPGVELNYVCDPDLTRPLADLSLVRRGARFGSRNSPLRTPERARVRLSSIAGLLTKPDVDGVLIATPGSTHASIALPFIKKGIPTFIEKPMTTSLPDAKKLADAAKKSGSLVFAGHIHLYNPAYLAAKKLIQEAGKIRYLYFEGTDNGPFRDDMSAMWDWAPHDVYMALDLLGTMPTHVQAWGMFANQRGPTLNDGAIIKLRWANLNIDTHILVSSLFPEKRNKMIAVCDKSTIVFDDTLLKEPGKSPLQLELEAFVGCIINKQQPISDINQGLAVVKILAAAEKSIKLDGKRVKIL